MPRSNTYAYLRLLQKDSKKVFNIYYKILTAKYVLYMMFGYMSNPNHLT